MDLRGKTVFHKCLNGKTFAPGNIIEVKESDTQTLITVLFSDISKTMMFEVPRAFDRVNDVQPFLTTEDKELSEWIERVRKQYCCEVCRSRAQKLHQRGHIKVCPSCLDKVVTCKLCGESVLKSEAKQMYLTGEWQCSACYEKTHVQCSVCGEMVEGEDIVRNKCLQPEQNVCRSCFDRLFTECDECGNHFPREEVKQIRGYNYCRACEEKKTGLCSACGNRSFDLKEGLCPDCLREKIYLQHFSDISFLNARTESVSGNRKLTRDMATTQLMSRLNKSCSENPFDILLFTHYLSFDGRSYDLIVVPELPQGGYNTSGYGCTMTEFKTDVNHWAHRRFKELLKEESCVRVEIDEKSNLLLLRKAYTLQAQTYGDKDYGDRWYGRDYVEEGNKYGDTSEFYIIGAIEHIR